MGEMQGNNYNFVHCSSLWQCQCCFVFKLCKPTTINPDEEKKKRQLSIVNKQKICELAKKEKS